MKGLFRHSLLVATALLPITIRDAGATTEICGNSIDDDGNGLTDEGCYPSLTTGVCESPLSCGDTGMISWSTGSLHYDLPPDIAPAVPFGPGIGLRRFYTSQYSPTGANPLSVNHTPLGANWQHTYMTWLYDDGVSKIYLHTSQGRDVLYSSPTSCGTNLTCYMPQAGDHVLSLKKDTSSGTKYTVQLLTGEKVVYNDVGQIIEIWDTLGPTPNKVLITWTGTTNGNVSTVTDASGNRRLSFNYTNNLLTSVNFQTNQSSVWTTQHTTTYDYTNGVTRDATSQWFVPQNNSEWTNLLAGTDITNPTNMWQCQEDGSVGHTNLADSIGSATLTATNNGGMTYNNAVTGWTRKAVKLTEGQTSKWASGSTFCNPKTTKCTAFGLVAVSQPTGTNHRDVFGMGDSNGALVEVTGQTILPFHYTYPNEYWNNVATLGNSAFTSAAVQPWVISADPVALFTTLRARTIVATPTWATGTSNTGTFTVGNTAATSAAASFLYMAAWNGVALTAAQQSTLNNRIINGAGLSQVTIGGTLAQKYLYNDSGFLTYIQDGGGNQIVAFSYSSTNAGEVDLVTTSRGTVGLEYSTSRTGCTAGNTVLYFNQGNTTNCSVDGDCGAGFMCGGKTGTGATGKCFLAARCLTKSTVNGESVITSVAPLGPGGGSCSGACTDVMAYAWTAGGSGNINVIGREDPLANYTSVTYNANGLPTQIGYGDTNSNPADGGTNRTEYLFYDATYPARLVERRRASDLSPNAASCSSASTTGCQQTLYCFGNACSGSCANDSQLCTIEEKGFTLDATNAVVTYDNKITYIHDSKGRISEIDGAIAGIKTVYDYFTPGGSANGIQDNFLSDYKIYSDATHFLQPQITTYDFWGHPTSLKDPNGQFTCDAYDTSLGFQSSRKRLMATSQTDCTSTSDHDLTTSWARDSWQRLTQLTRPDTSCVHYIYDGYGRMSQIKRRDDCTAANAGDTQTFSYTADFQVSEVDTLNSGGTTIAKQPYTYFASRRLQEIVNPVSPSNFTGLVYDSAGKVTEVDGAGSLAKTVYHFDNAPGRDGRVTSEERYKTSLTSDTWSLLYAWMGGQSQVTDGDSKVTGSARDDLSRLVRITSPDLAGPTVRIYDAAGNLTTIVEDVGGGANQQTHAFTFDSMGRRLKDDYQGVCATTGTAHAEIVRSFDTLPTGVTCPADMATRNHSCRNTAGRLAYVQTILMCSSTYSATDGSLDQVTYFSYDEAGRVEEEFTTDDTGRIAHSQYTYTTNGALTQVTTPSGATLGWTYGSVKSNSDTDLVTAMSVSGTTIADTIAFFPFGPWQSYSWKATIGGTPLSNSVDRNLAYRITNVHGALQNMTENAKVAITEDVMGRVTSRVYTPHDPTLAGLFDSYFTYDEQSRVLCESTTSGACPTSGSTLKNNHDLATPFTAAGDWKEILRPVPGSTGGTINNFNTSGTYGTSHQVTDVNQSNGTPALGHTAFAYDARGLRSYDDNTTSLTNDRRDYTYDARRNVVNVRGQYKTGGVWHYYDVASAFDHKNRRVFKSFYDETTAKTAQWFFYYDMLNRLTEVKYTPDSSVSNTFSLFQLSWLDNKLIMFSQADWVTGLLNATSKRYVAADETDRPIQLWNWPSTGDATRVWAINPSGWGADTKLVGATLFQPVKFGGQYEDNETVAYENDGSTIHRPGVVVNGYRTYDPFIGAYMQLDPLVERTWSSYLYVGSCPVGRTDTDGLGDCFDINGVEVCQPDEVIEVSGTAPSGDNNNPGVDVGGGWQGYDDPPLPKPTCKPSGDGTNTCKSPQPNRWCNCDHPVTLVCLQKCVKKATQPRPQNNPISGCQMLFDTTLNVCTYYYDNKIVHDIGNNPCIYQSVTSPSGAQVSGDPKCMTCDALREVMKATCPGWYIPRQVSSSPGVDEDLLPPVLYSR